MSEYSSSEHALSEQEEAVEAANPGEVPATEAGSGADTIEEYDALGGSEEPSPS